MGTLVDCQGDLKLSNPTLWKNHEKKLKAFRLWLLFTFASALRVPLAKNFYPHHFQWNARERSWHVSRNIYSVCKFPQCFPVFPYERESSTLKRNSEHASSKNNLRARVSEHSFIIASNSSIGLKYIGSTFKLNGTIRYPNCQRIYRVEVLVGFLLLTQL